MKKQILTMFTGLFIGAIITGGASAYAAGILAERSSHRIFVDGQEVPVIITSSEDDESFIQKAYELGVTDYIRRPFNLTVTQRRVSSALTLYARQKHLVHLAEEQVYEREKTNSAIINILSHVVESRNFESGTHILHVRTITDILLRQLVCTSRNGAQNRKEASWLTTNFSLACSPQRRR